jgi:hypothetical protein
MAKNESGQFQKYNVTILNVPICMLLPVRLFVLYTKLCHWAVPKLLIREIVVSL